VSPRTIRLRLDGAAAADRSYAIVVGQGVIDSLGVALTALAARRAVVVADEAIAATHAALADATSLAFALVLPAACSAIIAGFGIFARKPA
jgi:hypothetical protein